MAADRPVVKLSGGPASGYKAEMYSPPVYLLHSPLRTKSNAHKDAATVTLEAEQIWDSLRSMKLSDFNSHSLPTAQILIRTPTQEELESLGNG